MNELVRGLRITAEFLSKAWVHSILKVNLEKLTHRFDNAVVVQGNFGVSAG